MTDLTKVKYHNTKLTKLKMLLNVLLNSAVDLNRSPSLGSLSHTGWDTCLASVAPLASITLKVLLNAARKLKSCKS